ncbi:MAG TPA: hypothetical protein VFH60_04905 [Chloroflexia bacterium]|nr:hypothetical protein [Chloroflexia bacterium]HYP20621.1 hypothetical protein [Chloroflexia bacterium]
MAEEAEQTGQDETNAVDENRRQLRSNFDAINQTAKDTRQKTRDLYAGRDNTENERWGRREADSEYVNEVGDNDSSGG